MGFEKCIGDITGTQTHTTQHGISQNTFFSLESCLKIRDRQRLSACFSVVIFTNIFICPLSWVARN